MDGLRKTLQISLILIIFFCQTYNFEGIFLDCFMGGLEAKPGPARGLSGPGSARAQP